MTTPDDYRLQYAKSLNDHGAFVKAMNAGKHDHLPALVYADYLDDHGDSGAAEVIRRHIAADNIPLTFRYVGGKYSVNHPEDGRPFVDMDIHRTPHRDGDGDPFAIIRIMHKIPDHTPQRGDEFTDAIYHGHGIDAEPEEAHRLVSNMPNVHGAELAKAELEWRFPWLRTKE